MKLSRTIAAFLFAIPVIVFGSNYFFDLIPAPADESVGMEILQTMHDGGMMLFVALTHIILGVLILIPMTRFIGALLHLPITLGMLAFHLTLMPAGLGLAGFLLLLNVLVILDRAKIEILLNK